MVGGGILRRKIWHPMKDELEWGGSRDRTFGEIQNYSRNDARDANRHNKLN